MNNMANITLSEDGIKKIIAQHFDASLEKTTLKVNTNGKIECYIDLLKTDEETTTKNNIITKEMIKEGLNKNIVLLIVDPNMGDGTVCSIGEYWFYFGGLTAEENNPEEYAKSIPRETIIDEIYDTLEDFRQDPDTFSDEYQYYYWYLKENT